MPRFSLEIELGDDAMQTKDDIINSLKTVTEEMIIEDDMYVSEHREIYDDNGNTVGHYEVRE